MKPRSTSLAAALASIVLGACSTSAVHVANEVPESLRAPAGEQALAALHAEGTQAYECTAGTPQPEWKFKGPTAVLTDSRGDRAGTHYAGPTWESLDGSKVVGQAVASAPAADGKSIPQLLLKTRLVDGRGTFARVRSIQRLDTRGGQPPQASCPAAEIGRRLEVPYTATYVFYG